MKKKEKKGKKRAMDEFGGGGGEGNLTTSHKILCILKKKIFVLFDLHMYIEREKFLVVV